VVGFHRIHLDKFQSHQTLRFAIDSLNGIDSVFRVSGLGFRVWDLGSHQFAIHSLDGIDSVLHEDKHDETKSPAQA
jgi:hypothetical protein